MTTPRAGNASGVALFVALVTAGVSAILVVADPVLVPGRIATGGGLATAIALLVFVAAGQLSFDYQRGGVSETVSVTHFVSAVAIVVVGPFGTIVARVAADLGVSLLVRRPAIKTAANAAGAYAEVVAAVVTYGAVVHVLGTGWWWLAIVVAGAVADVAAVVVVHGAIAIYFRDTTAFRHSPVAFGLVMAVVDSACGAITLLVHRAEPGAVVLLVVVPAMIMAGYRNHARLAREVRRLAIVHQFTSAISARPSDTSIAADLVRTVVDLIGARDGWIVVDHNGAPSAARVRLGEDDVATGAPTALERAVHAGADGETRLVAADDAALGALLDAEDISQLMLASVRADSLVATLVVCSARDAVEWSDDDVVTFDSLANQASIALQAGDLAARLDREMGARVAAAVVDPLTGLMNRTGFDSVVAAAMDTDEAVAVVLVDLDRFAIVNDSLGHDSGDHVLRAVAGRLERRVAAGGSVARVGGDQFAVLLRDATPEAAQELAAIVLQNFADEPFGVPSGSVSISASIGHAHTVGGGLSAHDLIGNAAFALRQAKKRRGCARAYASDVDHRVETRRELHLTHELTRAIDEGSLELAWQPQVDLATNEVIGAEALVRWNHPELGFVSPGEFVPLAEETGLIAPLTNCVVQMVVDAIVTMPPHARPGIASVNLSVHNLLDRSAIDFIIATIDGAGLPRSGFCFEVTETAAMIDPVASQHHVAMLARAGFAVSVDDFGTGHSSLVYLHDLEVDEIKIDRHFIDGLIDDPSAASIVTAITALASNLGLQVVAEGIETDEHAARAFELGCRIGQGFGLYRPMPTDAFAELLGSLARGVAVPHAT